MFEFGGESGFLTPSYFALLSAVMLLMAVLAYSAHSRAALCRRLGISLPPKTPFITSSLVALLLVVALSRPYWGSDVAKVTDSEDEVMFLVDVSRSMLAKDVPPSRMALAKRKMEDIIDAFAARGVPQRYGITLFAGGSYVLCPSTSDIPVVKQFIGNISPDIVTSLGSQLTLGLKTAIERLVPPDPDRGAVRGKRLVLLSDGEDERLQVETAAQMIKASGIRLDVLGVGTPGGATIQLPNGSLLHDTNGATVQSKLNESSLEQLASAGGGIYVRATLSDADIERIATRVTPAPGLSAQGTKREIVTYRELGPPICVLALVILLVLVGRRRSLVLALGLTISSGTVEVHAQTAKPTPSDVYLSDHSGRDGYDLYRAGKFSEAVSAFEKAVASAPQNVRFRQGLASSLFKIGRYEDALNQFHSITERTRDGKEYFENTYNEGNALLALGRYRDAIDAYHRALDVKGDDERVVNNLNIARRLLEEEKNRPTPTPTPTPPLGPPPSAQTPSATSTPNPSPSPSNGESSAHTPSPSPAPSQSPGQSPSPPPEDRGQDAQGRESPTTPSPQPGQQPSPSSIPSPASSPHATPTGDPDEKQTESDPERLKESKLENPEDNMQPPAPRDRPTPAPQESPPAMKEAEAWLESLPESPLIITKERGRQAPTGQTW